MALAHGLSQAGHVPAQIKTNAKVSFEKQGEGFAVTGIHLTTEAQVPGIDQATFQKFADGAKANCPISKALASTKITLDAKLA
jgi:osmotically inducible protein OsmC